MFNENEELCIKNDEFCSCNAGCLYEIKSDPTEHVELSAKYPAKVRVMTRRIEELKETAFTPVRCGPECDDGFGNIACGSCGDPRACEKVRTALII